MKRTYKFILFFCLFQVSITGFSQSERLRTAIKANDTVEIASILRLHDGILDSLIERRTSMFSHDYKLPIHIALESAELSTINFLISRGADLTRPMKKSGLMYREEVYALELLIDRGDVKLLKSLINQLEIVATFYGEAIGKVAASRNREMFDVLVEFGSAAYFSEENDMRE